MYAANSPCKIRQLQRDNLPKKNRQIVLHVRQIRFRQIVFRQIVPDTGQFAERQFAEN